MESEKAGIKDLVLDFAKTLKGLNKNTQVRIWEIKKEETWGKCMFYY